VAGLSMIGARRRHALLCIIYRTVPTNSADSQESSVSNNTLACPRGISLQILAYSDQCRGGGIFSAMSLLGLRGDRLGADACAARATLRAAAICMQFYTLCHSNF